jgi:hypothetical protein
VRAPLALVWLAGCASIVGLPDPQPVSADGPSCAHSPCDLEDGCGCQRFETCSWNTDQGASYCRTSGGSSRLGEACLKDADCQIGTSCVYGECRRYCVAAAACGATSCTADFTPFYPVKTCSDACTPISNAGCPSTSCLIIQGQGTTFCLAGDTTPIGAACDQAPFSCVPGAVCHNENGAFKCRAQCDPNGAACATGTCTTAPDLVVGGTQYGVCI